MKWCLYSPNTRRVSRCCAVSLPRQASLHAWHLFLGLIFFVKFLGNAGRKAWRGQVCALTQGWGSAFFCRPLQHGQRHKGVCGGVSGPFYCFWKAVVSPVCRPVPLVPRMGRARTQGQNLKRASRAASACHACLTPSPLSRMRIRMLSRSGCACAHATLAADSLSSKTLKQQNSKAVKQ